MSTLAQLATSPEASALYVVILGAIEKKFQFIKPIVKWGENHKGAVATMVAEGETLASNLIHSPALAGVKLELDHVKNQLDDSKLVQLAGQVLHAAGKRLDELTPNQKTGFALVVSTEAKKLGLSGITQTRVESALDIADKAVADIEGLSLFQSTAEIDAAKVEAPTEPAQPADQPATA